MAKALLVLVLTDFVVFGVIFGLSVMGVIGMYIYDIAHIICSVILIIAAVISIIAAIIKVIDRKIKRR